MKRLVRCELKKIWSQVTILSVISLIVFSTVVNLITFSNSIPAFTSDGELVRGFGSYRTIKNDYADVTGMIDQNYLDNLVNGYNNSIEEKELVKYISRYHTKYTRPNTFVNYAMKGSTINYPTLELDEQINEDEFYYQFKQSMFQRIRFVNEDNWFPYTDEHMKLIQDKIDNIETPFSMGYIEGLSIFNWKYEEQYLVMLLIIGFSLSSLFSKDSNNGINELSLSSKFGRRKNMDARILAGNITATIIYLVFVGVLLIEVGAVASFQGWSMSIQSLWMSSTYDISVGSGILIMLGYGFLVTILVANLVMLVSMKIKYYMISVVVSVGGIWFLNMYSSNAFLAQFNPVGIMNNFSAAFNIYYFIGDIVVPYTVALVGILAVYLIAIRWLTMLHYKKYKLD